MNSIQKDFLKALAEVENNISASEMLDVITKIANKLPEETKQEIVDGTKDIAISENLEESKGTKKSLKELVGEIFPSLSFYPALGMWGFIDKMIQSNDGFDALSEGEARKFAVYMALFFGLVGSKIAYNRIKERLSITPEQEKEINEALQVAGVKQEKDIILNPEQQEWNKLIESDSDYRVIINNENIALCSASEITHKNMEDSCGFIGKHCFMLNGLLYMEDYNTDTNILNADKEIIDSIKTFDSYKKYFGNKEIYLTADDVRKYGNKLEEDTVKQGNSWTNKGKEGTHGKFKTKKAADSQRKAMFANGYKG